MASPPRVHSPLAMSPPYGSPAPNPPKKRSSALDMTAPPTKRRKGSIISQASGASSHPLRQTSFPPEAGASPYPTRSPSVDAASHVSGSVASGTTGGGGQRRRRGGRTRLSRGGGENNNTNNNNDAGGEKTPSLAGGRAPTTASGQSAAGGGGGGSGAAGSGDKDALDEEEDDEKAEMALEDVVARTQEQKQEEIRLRAMLVEAFDGDQYNRYELWRAAKLSDAVVKRVVNATVSQSVPQMVATAVKAVAKLFAGEIIEAARNVQDEWILAGEKQSDLPSPPASTASNHENTDNADNAEAREQHGEGALREEGSAGAEAQETKTDEDAKPDDEEDRESKGEQKKKKKKREKKRDDGADLRRGPLRPDHLREAWRRYKMCGESQGVGVQQLWQTQQGTGVGRFSTRTRTRLFR